MFWKTLVIVFFVAGVFAEFELDESKKNQLKDALKVQCKKVNAEDKADDVANAVHAFINCSKQLVDIEQLKKEIEEAKPNGALDEVFKKYCEKTPQLKTCIHSLFDGVSPCLDDNTKQYMTSFKNGTDQLIDFVCFKDGDRIALFIAEHGPECFQAKANEIRTCAETVKESVSGTNVESISLAVRCTKYDELSDCIVKALETCDNPTPGNMAESLFKYVRKSSPCNDVAPKA